MSELLRKLDTVVIPQTAPRACGSVIFLHGAGDTAPGFQGWVTGVLEIPELQFPHLRILYPTAPLRPYSLIKGQLCNVWYDWEQLSPEAPDDESIDETASLLSELINSEVQQGIPISNIIVGGLSMGGGMALQLAFRYYRDIAGVFAMSSFLGNQSLVYQALESDNSATPPLFQSHGEADRLLLHSWGKDTYEKLTSLGVIGQFHSVPHVGHEMDKGTLLKLCEWINERVPQGSGM